MFTLIRNKFANGWLALMLALGAIVLGFVSAPLRAQENNLRADLVAEGPAIAGEQVMLAITFSPVASEWHGYWSNPGDAGLGLQLEWNLPEGFEAGRPIYPVPERLTISGLMNHVYKGDYAVLVPLTVPENFAGSGTIPISANAQWLACTDEICVPEGAELRSFISSDPAAEKDARFAEWSAAIAPLLDSEGGFAFGDQNLEVEIPLPASVELADPHIFIENDRLVSYSAAQVFTRDGDRVFAQIPLRAGEDIELPIQVRGIFSFGGGQGVEFIAKPADVTISGEAIAVAETTEAPNMLILILGALAGGLLLNIMPCVFPILSLKALALAKAGGSEAQARSDGLAYTAGVVIACVALGAIMLALRAAGEQVGWAFQLQSPGVVVFLLVLAVGITANFAGLFELPQLSITGSGEKTGSFATGLLAAFVATPCTGPFMAAALGAALLLPIGPALLLFAMLGLGLALPFLLIGFVPALRKMLPKPGAWMEKFRHAMAIPMGLTALALIWLVTQLGGCFAVV